MPDNKVPAAYPSFSPVNNNWSAHSSGRVTDPDDEKSPKKPDWLLIMVSVLFMLTLLIAWLINRPDV